MHGTTVTVVCTAFLLRQEASKGTASALGGARLARYIGNADGSGCGGTGTVRMNYLPDSRLDPYIAAADDGVEGVLTEDDIVAMCEELHQVWAFGWFWECRMFPASPVSLQHVLWQGSGDGMPGSGVLGWRLGWLGFDGDWGRERVLTEDCTLLHLRGEQTQVGVRCDPCSKDSRQ